MACASGASWAFAIPFTVAPAADTLSVSGPAGFMPQRAGALQCITVSSNPIKTPKKEAVPYSRKQSELEVQDCHEVHSC